MSDGSFFSELRKRKVVQSAAIYGAVAWGVTEVLVTIVEQLFLPQWVSTLTVIFFVVGFPVAMFLSWTFDLTAEGIHRTDIKSKRGTASIAVSLVLLIAGTVGLFFLIKPSLDMREEGRAIAVVLEPNSIAVLPFANNSARADDAYLAGGLSDELRDQLARMSGLRIAARSSSFAAVRQGLDALAASSRLGVAHIVEGSVRRQGNVLTVSVQLIDGRNGLVKWSRQFQRGAQELLNVQQAIAEAVVDQVLPNVEVALAKPATRDPTANEYMLQARHLEQQVRERVDVDKAALLESVRLYRKATEVDPGSALAFSRLAGALLYLGDVDAAVAPINKALTLAPNLSEVQVTLGELRWAQGMVGEADIAWRRAVELNPNNPEALASLAMGMYYQIETDGVAELYRRALDLDPLNLERFGALGNFLAFENYFDEAYELIDKLKELPDSVALYSVIAHLLEQLGDVDEAIGWTIRARDLEPDNPQHQWKLAEYYADIGDFDSALSLDPDGIGVLFKMRRYEDVIERAEFAMIDEPEDMRLRATLASAYVAIGEYESAIHVLSSTGLPDSVFKGWRSLAEYEGYMTLQNALWEIGQIEMAQDLATFTVEQVGYTPSYAWWVTVMEACDKAILGHGEEVRNALERAQKGRLLVWDFWLKDAPCLKRYSDDPVYRDTVAYYEGLRAGLRKRLPSTLAEMGVEL
jgi:TolB-like protein/cytochrome c-type biogenesis protein CcmH/NrfG